MSIRIASEKKLLDAADDLFFTRGIAATPVDVVLARAGVSAATLYRGFATKEALVAAALARRHEAWTGVWEGAIAASGSPRERLLAVFTALDAFRERPDGARWCAFLGSAAEYTDPPEQLREVIDNDGRSLRDRLLELALAVVSPERAAPVADALLLIVTGHLAMQLRDPGSDSRTARWIAEVLIDGSGG